jgi:LmbE family N-acetylglucosaminyl deacetylase
MTEASGLDILYVLAHPDDETFGHAGLISWATSQGRRVGLVCATRGEVGEISDPSLGTPEMLGAVRERELRRAMAIIGVDPIRLLGYRDSGMAGSETNEDPRCLVQADRAAVLSDVVFHIRDLRPHAVVTFGPDGVYGHPDHIRIGEIATEAITVSASDELPFLGEPWEVSRLFHVAVAREFLLQAKRQGSGFFSRLSDEEIGMMGIPGREVTHAFDVSDFIATKIEAIKCHATQQPFNPEPGSPGDPAMRPRLGTETLKRMPLPWTLPDELPDFLDEAHQPALLPTPAGAGTD